MMEIDMLVDYTLLVFACVLAYVTRRFMLGLLFVVGIVIFEMISAGGVRGTNCWFLVVSIFPMLLMIKEDSARNGNDAFWARYNPYYINNKLPQCLRYAILVIFLAAYIVRLIVVFFKIRQC